MMRTLITAVLFGMAIAITAMVAITDHHRPTKIQDSGPFIIAPGYRVTDQRNGYEVGISCKNGADPTGNIFDNLDGTKILIVSCGKEEK